VNNTTMPAVSRTGNGGAFRPVDCRMMVSGSTYLIFSVPGSRHSFRDLAGFYGTFAAGGIVCYHPRSSSMEVTVWERASFWWTMTRISSH
jgi:hypothetical protein